MSDGMFSKSGYNEEDHYVAKHEAEKIQKLRDDRAAKKAQAEKEAHWMKCPKCGSDMEEIELEAIMIDKCTSCHGVYFDDGELELLLDCKTSSSLLDKVRGFWK